MKNLILKKNYLCNQIIYYSFIMYVYVYYTYGFLKEKYKYVIKNILI